MKKILLVENNEDIRNNTAEILELFNYAVMMAKNGKNGVQKALKFLPNLIICNILVPVPDGYAVFDAVHKKDTIKNIPYICPPERSELRKGMELGADYYISKHFTGTEL